MKTAQYPPTPELDKMKSVKDQSEIIGGFIDWLSCNQLEICIRNPDDDLFPVRKSIEQLLAQYFKINLNKCERERQAVLSYVRANQ